MPAHEKLAFSRIGILVRLLSKISSCKVKKGPTMSVALSPVQLFVQRARRLTLKKIVNKILRTPAQKLMQQAMPTLKNLGDFLIRYQPRLVRLALGTPLCDDPSYFRWILQNYPRKKSLDGLKKQALGLVLKPTISIVLPVYNPPIKFLRQALDSVLQQVYPYWELCIVDDASTDPRVTRLLQKYQTKDSRIKVVFQKENSHISVASNRALDIATGEFFGLLDHDDVLAPHALLEVAKLINRHPDLDLVYSDEDKMDEKHCIKFPYFKPDWSPDTLLTKMYTCHLSVYRKAIVDRCGRFRRGFEGAQDYDLALRVTEQTDKIHHIPTILYHWRMHPGSIAMGLGPEVKPYAYVAARDSVVSALARRKEAASVSEVAGLLGFWDVRYEISQSEKVSIVLAAKFFDESLVDCLTGLLTTDWPDMEIWIVGFAKEHIPSLVWECQGKRPDCIFVYCDASTNSLSGLKNSVAEHARGRYLLFLDPSTRIADKTWLKALVEQAQRSAIGAVGGMLKTPQNIVYHGGITLGIQEGFGYSHRGDSASNSGYVGVLQTTTNYSALSGECLLCRREVFLKYRGFDEQLADSFDDIDFCLRLRTAGFQNVYVPHSRLIFTGPWRLHVPVPNDGLEHKRQIFKDRWSKYIGQDPCYNPNLTHLYEDFRMAIAY